MDPHAMPLHAALKIDRLTAALEMLIQVHAAVEFDTPEDNAIRDRAVATARLALSSD